MASRAASIAYLRRRAHAGLYERQRNALAAVAAFEEEAVAVFNAAGGAPPPPASGLRGMLAAVAGLLYSPADWGIDLSLSPDGGAAFSAFADLAGRAAAGAGPVIAACRITSQAFMLGFETTELQPGRPAPPPGAVALAAALRGALAFLSAAALGGPAGEARVEAALAAAQPACGLRVGLRELCAVMGFHLGRVLVAQTGQHAAAAAALRDACEHLGVGARHSAPTLIRQGGLASVAAADALTRAWLEAERAAPQPEPGLAAELAGSRELHRRRRPALALRRARGAGRREPRRARVRGPAALGRQAGGADRARDAEDGGRGARVGRVCATARLPHGRAPARVDARLARDADAGRHDGSCAAAARRRALRRLRRRRARRRVQGPEGLCSPRT